MLLSAPQHDVNMHSEVHESARRKWFATTAQTKVGLESFAAWTRTNIKLSYLV